MGESKLSEVAQRLGVDAESLQAANPQIPDTEKLKVGQEILLPQFQKAPTLQPDAKPDLQSQGLKSGLSRKPIGDPLTRNAMRARLSAADLAQVPGGRKQVNASAMKGASSETSLVCMLVVATLMRSDF
jgi:LysM repeat protein